MIYELCGHRIDVPHATKVLWAGPRYTVDDLIRYYTAVWPWMEPYLADRPVVYETFPGTIDGPHDFQQDPPPHTPRWIKRVKIAGRERTVTYVVIDTPAAIVYLAGLYAVTLHVWMSTTRAIERPDFLLLDLDPGIDCTLARLARVSLMARDIFKTNGFRDVRVKSSGASGLHVSAALESKEAYPAARAAARGLAAQLFEMLPRDVTLERAISVRPSNAVYVDFNQMGRGMTIVPPFSARASNNASVAMPLTWDEIDEHARSKSRRPPAGALARYTIKSAVPFLQRHGDPWMRDVR